MLFAMDSALYASTHVLDVNECNVPCVCDNVSMSDDPHDCDAMLHESLGVVDIPNIKLFKKNAKFQKNLSKLFCENDDLIAKLNESNKLVKKYKKRNRRLCDKLDFLKRKIHSSMNEVKKDESCFEEIGRAHV